MCIKRILLSFAPLSSRSCFSFLNIFYTSTQILRLIFSQHRWRETFTLPLLPTALNWTQNRWAITPWQSSHTFLIPALTYVHPCDQPLAPVANVHVANLRKWIRANLHGLITLLFYKVINESDSRLRAAWRGVEGFPGISCQGKSVWLPCTGPTALTAEGCGIT